MKTTLLLALAALLVSAGYLAGRWRPGAAAGPGNRQVLYYVDPMHPAYRSDTPGTAPDCGMALEPVYADGAGPAEGGAPRPAGTVSLDAGKRQLQGVRIGTAEKVAASHSLRLLGRVVPDETRVHTLNAAAEGSVRELSDVTTGSRVRRGQWLGSVFMAETRSALQAYITALDVQDLDPQRRAHEGMTVSAGTSPGRSAQYTVERLRALGVSQRQIDELRLRRDIPLTVSLYAPVDGWVLARGVAHDQKFEKGAEWFRIANLDKVWVLADLTDADGAEVRPGQKARVTLPGGRGPLAAEVSQVPPQFDAASSTLKVRLLVDNPGATLRPDMFVDVDLQVERPMALTVPVDAVVDGGLRKTVFVERGGGVFEPRRVETGRHLGERVEIVQGLAEGDRIVVSGTFMVDSESRMKAAAAGLFGEPSRDPVCGMEVDEARARAAGTTHQHAGRTYSFCSEQCRRTFAASPEAVLRPSTGQGASQGQDHGHAEGHGQDQGRQQARL